MEVTKACFIALCVSSICGCLPRAEWLTIEGQVLDVASHKPVSGARVTVAIGKRDDAAARLSDVEGASEWATTTADQEGRFHWRRRVSVTVSPFSIWLRLSASGYAPVIINSASRSVVWEWKNGAKVFYLVPMVQ